MTLHYAAWTGNTKWMRRSFVTEPTIFHESDGGWTPLHLAGWNMHEDVVDLILTKAAEIGEIRNEKGTLLEIAAENNDCRAMSLSVEIHGHPNARRDVSQYLGPLHVAARHGHVEALRLLMKFGADINQRDSSGMASIHWAAFGGYIEAITALHSEFNVDINTRTESGKSPIHFASERGHGNAIKLLRRYGADLNNGDNEGKTSAHWAALGGHIESITVLNDLEADFSARDDLGMTPMHWAAERGWLDVITMLPIGYVTETDRLGRTPIHYAAWTGQVNAIELLHSLGGNIEAQDLTGETPIDLAREQEHFPTVELLESLVA
jgi:ankyrin repeat protein